MSTFLPNDKVRCLRGTGSAELLATGSLYCVHGTSNLTDGTQILWLHELAYRNGEGWADNRFELVHRSQPAGTP